MKLANAFGVKKLGEISERLGVKKLGRN